MELKSLQPILQDAQEDLVLTDGVYWFITIDLSTTEEIFKLISFTNDHDIDSEVRAFALNYSEDLKNWVSSQDIQLKLYIITESLKSSLEIESVPWFTCIKNSNIVYSNSALPQNLKFLNEDEELTQLKSPEKKEKKNPTPELPNFSQAIARDAELELDRALKKIKKLKQKLAERNQTIEDYKSEILLLKAELSSQNREEPLNNFVLEKRYSHKVQAKVNARFDENEFWKVEEKDDFQQSIKFDDIAVSKDLWLMGLINGNKPARAVALPPIQLDQSKKSKSTQRPQINNKSLKSQPKNQKNASKSIIYY